jgi:nucleoid-associated protein YgaU
VKKGDTLFGIARANYGSGSQWQRIAAANPGLSPSTLKAGQKITLP